MFFIFQFLSQILVLIDEHLEFSLYFFMILVDIIVVSQFLNRFCELGIDLDKFFQRLLQHGIFLLELVYFLTKLLVLALTCKIVFETIGHCWIVQIQVMKSQGEKFPFKKILEYIMKQQGIHNALRAFLKNTAENELKSLNEIKQFTNDNARICEKLKLKDITKLTTHFSIHNLQTQQIPTFIQLIEQKLYFWIEELIQRLQSLKEKTKAMESKKSILVQSQINTFKAQLTNQLVSINQRKQSIIKLFCHNIIKNNSHHLERITDLLKNQFENVIREKMQKS